MFSEAARHFKTGVWVRPRVEAGILQSLEPMENPRVEGEPEPWIAPAFWDIQTNGRWGISFSDPTLTAEQVKDIVNAQPGLGTSRLCPTLITAPRESLIRGVSAIAEACTRYPEVAAKVLGIHLEGPYISELDGYRGAHPLEAVHDPDWDEFAMLQDASGGRIVLVTLAPERPGAIEFIRKATAAGIVIALGHTAADGATIRAAVAAGARLSTHLGNGIVSPLPRHPNPIWEQAALDELDASFIADGHHLDAATLRVLVRAKGLGRVILVSDASPLAGLAPGRYGAWEVDPSGKVLVAGTPYLAGSNQGLATGLNRLIGATGATLADAVGTVTRNPARLLGSAEPGLMAGRPANFVVLQRIPVGSAEFTLQRSCVDGRWVQPTLD